MRRDGRSANDAAGRHARRAAWLAEVRAALREAAALVDALHGAGAPIGDAAARLAEACREVDALRAQIGVAARARNP